jgi:L-amino acid N-acyltransferase YncA
MSDAGVDGYKGSDIRNSIAPKHLLRTCGDKWIKNTWAETENPQDDIFLSRNFLEPFILSWAKEVPENIRATFLEQDIEEHWACDIDTNTGLLLQPVIFPNTMVNLETVDEELAWRQQNWSSTLLMRREGRRLNQRISRPKRHDPPPGWTETGMLNADIEQQAEQDRHTDPEPNPYAVRVACHLRPARGEDMEGVRDIYNLEMESGLQSFDIEPLSCEDFKKILITSRELKMPFIVAISDPDDKNTGAARLTSQDPRLDTSESRPPRVLAFGFLSVWQAGLAGNVRSTGRMTAQAHVYVHPRFRRQKLGHACLDKLLSTVSHRYATKLGCTFVNPEDDPVYKYPWNHERRYYAIYINYLVRTRLSKPSGVRDYPLDNTDNDRDLEWLEPFLKNEFRCWKAARLEACHRTRPGNKPRPVWLDCVIFEHVCQDDLNFTQIC